MYNNFSLLNAAFQEYGQREIPGQKHNPKIVNWLQSILSWVQDDETPWCSAFMNAMAEKVDLERTEKANARSWLDVGEVVLQPVIGDVVVLWRESPKSWKGHVGIYITHNDTHIAILGGNQGNEVNITWYPKTRLLGYRRLLPA